MSAPTPAISDPGRAVAHLLVVGPDSLPAAGPGTSGGAGDGLRGGMPATHAVAAVLVCGYRRVLADIVAAFPIGGPTDLIPLGHGQDARVPVRLLDGSARVAEIVEAIRGCMEGAPGRPRLSVAPAPLDEPGAPDPAQPAPPVSGRELQVLQLASVGRPNSTIARALGLSEATVKTYWQRIFEKVGSRDRTAAVALAVATGLIPGPRPFARAARTPAPDASDHTPTGRTRGSHE